MKPSELAVAIDGIRGANPVEWGDQLNELISENLPAVRSALRHHAALVDRLKYCRPVLHPDEFWPVCGDCNAEYNREGPTCREECETAKLLETIERETQS